MKKLVWLTDIHLDLYRGQKECNLYNSIKKENPDIIVIGGDISNADELFKDLKKIEKTFSTPIYFVLGNHDYETNPNNTQLSINDIRKKITSITQKSKFIKWLPAIGIVKLTKNTCLVGHDGWPDGRYGKYKKDMNIFTHALIYDFIGLTDKQIQKKMIELANESAKYICQLLPLAFNNYNHVFLLTHIPPFIKSCWYKPRGKIANQNMIPFFSNKAMGDVLLKNMNKFKDKQLTVLCGHTHGFGFTQIQSNLLTITGGLVSQAKGKFIGPKIQQIFNIV